MEQKSEEGADHGSQVLLILNNEWKSKIYSILELLVISVFDYRYAIECNDIK